MNLTLYYPYFVLCTFWKLQPADFLRAENCKRDYFVLFTNLIWSVTQNSDAAFEFCRERSREKRWIPMKFRIGHELTRQFLEFSNSCVSVLLVELKFSVVFRMISVNWKLSSFIWLRLKKKAASFAIQWLTLLSLHFPTALISIFHRRINYYSNKMTTNIYCWRNKLMPNCF